MLLRHLIKYHLMAYVHGHLALLDSLTEGGRRASESTSDLLFSRCHLGSETKVTPKIVLFSKTSLTMKFHHTNRVETPMYIADETARLVLLGLDREAVVGLLGSGLAGASSSARPLCRQWFKAPSCVFLLSCERVVDGGGQTCGGYEGFSRNTKN